jgi:hypothetical protein
MGIRKTINESPHGAAQVGDSIYKQSRDYEGMYEQKDGDGTHYLVSSQQMIVEEVKAWASRSSINPIGRVKE